MSGRRIVTIALLTQEELERVGPIFNRAWPIEDAPCFSSLLQAIDEAERELWRERDAKDAKSRRPARKLTEVVTQ